MLKPLINRFDQLPEKTIHVTHDQYDKLRVISLRLSNQEIDGMQAEKLFHEVVPQLSAFAINQLVIVSETDEAFAGMTSYSVRVVGDEKKQDKTLNKSGTVTTKRAAPKDSDWPAQIDTDAPPVHVLSDEPVNVTPAAEAAHTRFTQLTHDRLTHAIMTLDSVVVKSTDEERRKLDEAIRLVKEVRHRYRYEIRKTGA